MAEMVPTATTSKMHKIAMALRTSDLWRKLIVDPSSLSYVMRQMQCAPKFVVFQSYENN